jgi:hypothetical protein
MLNAHKYDVKRNARIRHAHGAASLARLAFRKMVRGELSERACDLAVERARKAAIKAGGSFYLRCPPYLQVPAQ